jgi:hypothetical protein
MHGQQNIKNGNLLPLAGLCLFVVFVYLFIIDFHANQMEI